MTHDTSFDVIKLFEDLKKFLGGIPSRLPDTRKEVSDFISRIEEITGEE